MQEHTALRSFARGFEFPLLLSAGLACCFVKLAERTSQKVGLTQVAQALAKPSQAVVLRGKNLIDAQMQAEKPAHEGLPLAYEHSLRKASRNRRIYNAGVISSFSAAFIAGILVYASWPAPQAHHPAPQPAPHAPAAK